MGGSLLSLTILISAFVSLEPLPAAEKPKASTLSLELAPSVCFPIAASADRFSIGGALGLSGGWSIPSFPFGFLRADLQYVYSPLVTGEHSISMVSAAAGGGLRLAFAPKFFVHAFLTGGYYYGFLNDAAAGFTGGGNPMLSAGGGFSFLLTPSLSMGLGFAYDNDFGFSSAIRAFLGTSYHIGLSGLATPNLGRIRENPRSLKPDPLLISEVTSESIFPVFYKHYDDHSVGKITLTNGDDSRVTDVKVSFSVQKYMDSPKECARIPELKAGEAKTVELFALFNDQMLEITEATKLAAEIIVSYTFGGLKREQRQVETLRVYNRNAMTWDDDRRVCAFVSATDPAVMTFAKNTAVTVKGKSSATVNANLLLALAMHEALSLYGVSYVQDPKTPYLELSRKKGEVDFLQFPRHTLEYKAGDCDDLSILYCALLESVAVETAFITVPGHIFIAFCLNMKPEEARSTFLRSEDFIFRDGKTWVPIEVTERAGGFLKAWQAGAKQWRESQARQQAGFYPVREGWLSYEPVGLSAGELKTAVPSAEKLVEVYVEEVRRFVEREIYPQAAKLQAEIQLSQGSAPAVNRLGVLYAKYGLMDKARIEFQRILDRQENLEALVNMGNTWFLQEDMEKAAEYYDRAYRLLPENPRALLCVARVNHETENYGLAAKAYARLKELDPVLAARFSYLDLKGEEGSRAAEMSQLKGVVIWAED
jgi:tetratricopeptide (TPR) repeat protein